MKGEFIMKRLIALLLVVLVCFSLLTACSGTCELCGKEGKVSSVKVAGEKRKLCESCEKIAKAAESYLS